MLEENAVLHDTTGAFENHAGIMSNDLADQIDALADYNRVLLQLIGTHADGAETQEAARRRLSAARDYVSQRGDVSFFLYCI